MARFTRLAHLLPMALLSVAPVLAQSGDKAGEEQKPLPADLKVPPAPVRSPEQEAATFTVAPGYRVELVAADPLVGDPIAAQFGPDGRLWVLEMRGLMPNVDGTGEDAPVGKVAVLADTDGDGKYDKRTVFADGLVMARALSLVGDGLLVAEPPKLWFFRDTDGDGKADSKTEVAGDYGDRVNPEHTANGLLWAMDNWIYSANHTVRFRYLGDGKFARENTVTRGQWGIAQDDVGRLFYNSNSDPLRHDVAPSEYLRRNPGFTAPGNNVQIVPGNLRIWPGRMTPGVNRGYKTLDSDFKLTSMTAASGPVVYRGTLFPKDTYGDAFVPEPSANLIKRIRIFEKDGLLSGQNAYDRAEFLTSTDERFRPVNLYNGPDGGLYVVDLYRGILQHRIYITTYLRTQILERGLDKGLGHGRIWRIVPESAKPAAYDTGLAKATGVQLVAKLSDGNGWVRDTAQRLIVERFLAKDPAADKTAEALRKLARDAKAPALARLHALWSLSGGGREVLDRATVLAALGDRDPRVVAGAIRVSEAFIDTAPKDAEIIARLASLADKAGNPAVRLQLAYTLGEVRTPQGDAALRTLAIQAGDQKYLAEAIVSSLAGREVAFVEALAKDPAAQKRAKDTLRFAMSSAVKSAKAANLDSVLALATAPGTAEWARTELLAGIKYSLPRSPDGRTVAGGRWPAEPKSLLALAAQKDNPAAKAVQQTLDLVRWPGKPGGAAVRPLTEAEQALYEKGKAQFAALCAACHQPNGQGLAGLAPSLIYSKHVLGDPRILARIILNGKIQENLIMPPWKAALDDEQVSAVMTYLRRSWDHDADPVSKNIVAGVREELKGRADPFTEEQLAEVAATLRPMRQRR